MKISFIRIINSELPEKYKSLSDNHTLYLTDNGYVYPEGSSRPIDIFDPEALSKISKNPLTTLFDKAKIEIDLETDNESIMSALNKNIDILSCIKQSRYASLRGLSEKLKVDKELLRNKLDILIHLNIIERYQSYYRITAQNKALIEFELSKIKE